MCVCERVCVCVCVCVRERESVVARLIIFLLKIAISKK